MSILRKGFWVNNLVLTIAIGGCIADGSQDYSVTRIAVAPVVGVSAKDHDEYARRLRAAICSELTKEGHLVYDLPKVDAAVLDQTKGTPEDTTFRLKPHPVALPRLDPEDLAIDAVLYVSMTPNLDSTTTGAPVSLHASLHPLVSTAKPEGGVSQVSTQAVWSTSVTVPASTLKDQSGALPLADILSGCPHPEKPGK